MIFTADITDSGEYVCEAKNKYGNITAYFDFNVVCKKYICMHTWSWLPKEFSGHGENKGCWV